MHLNGMLSRGLNGPINKKRREVCVRVCLREGETDQKKRGRDAVNGNKQRENSKHMVLRFFTEEFYVLQRSCKRNVV